VGLPLLRRNGEVRGLFELFSDHPYAFEERDLIALERMADLTATALDLAEQRQSSSPPPAPRRELGKPVELLPEVLPAPSPASSAPPDAAIPVKPELAEPSVPPGEPPAIASSLAAATTAVVTMPASAAAATTTAAQAPAPVPEAMLRVQKCASCGFPVSEGRTLCLDCEKKDSEKKSFEKKQREQAQQQAEQQIEEHQIDQQRIQPGEQEQDASPDAAAASAAPAQEEFVPAFLANSVPVQESWLANHVNLLAFLVLLLGILVAVVVFR